MSLKQRISWTKAKRGSMNNSWELDVICANKEFELLGANELHPEGWQLIDHYLRWGISKCCEQYSLDDCYNMDVYSANQLRYSKFIVIWFLSRLLENIYKCGILLYLSPLDVILAIRIRYCWLQPVFFCIKVFEFMVLYSINLDKPLTGWILIIVMLQGECYVQSYYHASTAL